MAPVTQGRFEFTKTPYWGGREGGKAVKETHQDDSGGSVLSVLRGLRMRKKNARIKGGVEGKPGPKKLKRTGVSVQVLAGRVKPEGGNGIK